MKCEKSYPDEFKLTRHIRHAHEGRKCKFCDEAFANKPSLMNHLESDHNEEYTLMMKCDICEQDFTNEEKLWMIHQK